MATREQCEKRLRENAFFTMTEDWQLQASADGTILTKTWREVAPVTPLSFSLQDSVRESAISESQQLVSGWNQAAQS